jgi:hypothetical protein
MSETQALEKRVLDFTELLGSSRDEREVTQRLERIINSKAKLVSPAVQCPKLQEGTAVAFSSVQVDLGDENQRHGEIYPVGGEMYGILKPALDRISLAANISWFPTVRRDDGRDPHYCSCMSSGTYIQFDGTEMVIPPGTATINLRDNSDECVEIIETKIEKALKRAKAKAKKERTQLSEEAKQEVIDYATHAAMRDIRRRRIKIEELAETGSRLRAIRATFGIHISYTLDQLSTPFVVARLMATGETNDPILRRDFARMNYERLTGGRRAMYSGEAAPPPRQLAASDPANGHQHHDDNVVDGELEDMAQPSKGRGEPSGTKAETTEAELPDVTEFAEEDDDEDDNEPESRYGDYVIPYGSKKGLALDDEEVNVSNLNWLLETMTSSIEDPEKKRWKAKNESERKLVLAELDRRGVGPGSKKTERREPEQQSLDHPTRW